MKDSSRRLCGAMCHSQDARKCPNRHHHCTSSPKHSLGLTRYTLIRACQYYEDPAVSIGYFLVFPSHWSLCHPCPFFVISQLFANKKAARFTQARGVLIRKVGSVDLCVRTVGMIELKLQYEVEFLCVWRFLRHFARHPCGSSNRVPANMFGAFCPELY